MNIKRSLNIALAKKDIKKGDFAKKLGISRARLYAIQHQKRVNPETLKMIADGLDMGIGEFISLSE